VEVDILFVADVLSTDHVKHRFTVVSELMIGYGTVVSPYQGSPVACIRSRRSLRLLLPTWGWLPTGC